LNKKKLYCWVSDYSNITGEGNLARFYIKKNLKEEFIVKISFNSKNLILKKINNYRYLSPLIGIIYCWYYFLKSEKVAFINYLPLWNFILFIFLPPGTILGPITGGALFKKKIDFNFVLRKFIFYIFYKISEFFLNLRGKNFYFSTNLLRIFLSKKTVKKNNFNFVKKLIFKKKRIKKDIDFLIYYRDHKNKKSMFNYKFLKFLEEKNLKIIIVGKKFKSKNIKNLGKISNKKLNYLLSKTKYTLSSNENLYSLFNIECINNNVRIFADKNLKRFLRDNIKDFIFVDFNNLKKINNLI
tara:strand:+ start:1238 stop:2131 length:894 start_codon:yes stop_codon:yes gene_type:complete